MPKNRIDFLSPLDPKFSEAEDWRIKKLLIEKVNEIAAALNNLIAVVQDENKDDEDDKPAGENDNNENDDGNDNLQQES